MVIILRRDREFLLKLFLRTYDSALSFFFMKVFCCKSTEIWNLVGSILDEEAQYHEAPLKINTFRPKLAENKSKGSLSRGNISSGRRLIGASRGSSKDYVTLRLPASGQRIYQHVFMYSRRKRYSVFADCEALDFFMIDAFIDKY